MRRGYVKPVIQSNSINLTNDDDDNYCLLRIDKYVKLLKNNFKGKGAVKMILTKEKLQADLLSLRMQGAQIAGAIQLLTAQIAELDKPEPAPEPAVQAKGK